MPQSNTIARIDGRYTCASCGEQQSDDPKLNACFCFPSLFGYVKRKPPPIQVFRTPDGKNNGLVALTSFDRGMAVGELVGLITKNVSGRDVMDISTPLATTKFGKKGLVTTRVLQTTAASRMHNRRLSLG